MPSNQDQSILSNQEIIDDIDPDFDAPQVQIKRTHKEEMEKEKLNHTLTSQKNFLTEVIKLFAFTNIFILIVVLLCACADLYLIIMGKITTDGRLITTPVILALIAAVVTQLGAVFLSASKLIFNKSN